MHTFKHNAVSARIADRRAFSEPSLAPRACSPMLQVSMDALVAICTKMALQMDAMARPRVLAHARINSDHTLRFHLSSSCSSLDNMRSPALLHPLSLSNAAFLQGSLKMMHEAATDAQRLMADIKPLIAKAEAIAAEARPLLPSSAVLPGVACAHRIYASQLLSCSARP